MFSRRDFLKTTGAGMIHLIGGNVIFGTALPSRVKAAFKKSSAYNALLELPSFDGIFSIDPQTLDIFSRDFGLNVSYKPQGVLRPGSVKDIQKIAKYCHAKNIYLTIKGFGGAAYGQTQILNGIVVDTLTLKKMRWVDSQTVALGPGLIWKDVLDFTISRKLAPPVLPDTIFTTVGGTASAGGIGETSYRLGGLVDHIVELTVVLMNGQKVICSPHNCREIFYAALAGMGQIAIIVEVKLQLMPAPDLVHTLSITYDAADLTYLKDLKLISSQENSGAIGGHIVKSNDGKLKYILEVSYWSETSPSWINETGGSKGEVKTWSYFEYSNRNTKGWYDAVNNGALKLPRPYLSFYLPESAIGSILDYISKDPEGMLGASRVYLTPLIRSNFKTPLLSLPKSKYVYHLRFYRIVRSGPGGTEHQRMLELNKNKLLPWILNLGGTMYLPFSPQLEDDQVFRQYSLKNWKQFSEVKSELDGEHILNHGVGLFSS